MGNNEWRHIISWDALFVEFIWGELSDCAVHQGVSTSSFVKKETLYPLGSAFDFTLIILARLFSIEFAHYISITSRRLRHSSVYIPTHPPRAAAAAYSAWLGKAHPPKKKWEIEFTKCLFLYNVSLTKNSVKISIRSIKGEKGFANEYMWVVGEILLSWWRRIHQKTISDEFIRVVLENMTY